MVNYDSYTVYDNRTNEIIFWVFCRYRGLFGKPW